MAVEYQNEMHYFNQLDEQLGQKPFFQYNSSHDLKAAIWIYVSFIFKTLPDCINAAATARIQSNVWFYCDELKTEGFPLRRGFVMHAARSALAELYERVPGGVVLVAGLSCFDVLKTMYRDIEATELLDPDIRYITWGDPKFFERRYYQSLYNGFMDVHAWLAGVGYSAILPQKFKRAAAQRACEDDGNNEEEDEEDDDTMEDDTMEVDKKEDDNNDSSKITLHFFRLLTPQGVEVV